MQVYIFVPVFHRILDFKRGSISMQALFCFRLFKALSDVPINLYFKWAVIGSIMALTSVMLLMGNAPSLACLRTVSSFFAM